MLWSLFEAVQPNERSDLCQSEALGLLGLSGVPRKRPTFSFDPFDISWFRLDAHCDASLSNSHDGRWMRRGSSLSLAAWTRAA